MSALKDLGWQLKSGKPDTEGLMLFRIVDKNDCEVAVIDRPCTVDEALSAARRLAEMEKENEE